MARNGGGRHAWVYEILDRAGAVAGPSGDGVHEYRLTDGLGDLLGREVLRFTFRKRRAGDGIELLAPGSWLHDQLLAYARERGRLTVGHLPAPADPDQESLVSGRRRTEVELLERRERRYGTLVLFTFRLAYYSEPPEEGLHTVVYDAERGRVVRRSLGRRLLDAARENPEDGFAPAPEPDLKAAFTAAWEETEDLVESRVHALQMEGRHHLERELATVERYYRQLIAEEKRHQKSRSSRRGHEESRRKIDLLKLEWERRVKEETERLRPQVVARLTAVARLRVPLERWRVRVGEGKSRSECDLWLDLARREVWEPPAPAGPDVDD